MRRKISNLILIFCVILLFAGGVKAAEITYSSSTFSINSGSVTLDDLYLALNNPAVLAKDGTVYTLTANIDLSSSATLIIDAEAIGGITLKFNEPSHNTYGITSSGSININNAIITSATGNAWYILNHNNAVSVNINNSDVSVYGQGSTPGIKFGEYPQYGALPRIFEWKNNKFHDNLGNYLVNSWEPFQVNHTGSEFYNLNTAMLTGGTYRNCNFHDLDTRGTWGHVLLNWGSGDVYDCEFYNINIGKPAGGALFYCKEGEGGSVFQNNYIHDFNLGSVLGIYGSWWTTPTIYRDNLIENGTIGNAGIIYWRANQYLGGVNITSEVYNNTIRNITNGGFGFVWHSGGQNARIWNNTFSNFSGVVWDFVADYQGSQAGGGQYHPGDSAGSLLYDMVFKNILINDLDNPADQSIRGQLFPFVNVKYNSVKVSMPDDYFYDYKYLDVKVLDANGDPVNGAVVAITNDVDSNYPPINLFRAEKTNFTTGTDGHTPLPADVLNTAAILDFWKTSTTQKEMTYTVTASYNSKTAAITGLNPDESWYRDDPNIYQNTVTIVIPVALESVLSSFEVDVYPNPYVKGKSIGEKITFVNVPKEATIKIYNSSGALVQELSVESGGKAEWDVSNVVSGVYLYVVTSSEGTKKGKVSVVK